MIQKTITLALFFCLCAPAAYSQTGGAGELDPLSGTASSAPGFFYKFERNDRLISVRTSGSIANAVVLVGEGATVGDLISLSGGVTVDRLGNATVRLHRQGRVVSEMEVRDLYTDGSAAPVLQEGDVVEVVGLNSTVPGFFVHTEPGVESFAVTASGAFASPGRYTLNAGSTVGDLVAYAGGLGSIGARDFRTDVTATVRLYRNGQVVIESPLTDLYAQPTMLLQPDDAVDLEVISRSRTPLWRDILGVTTTILGVVIVVERLL